MTSLKKLIFMAGFILPFCRAVFPGEPLFHQTALEKKEEFFGVRAGLAEGADELKASLKEDENLTPEQNQRLSSGWSSWISSYVENLTPMRLLAPVGISYWLIEKRDVSSLITGIVFGITYALVELIPYLLEVVLGKECFKALHLRQLKEMYISGKISEEKYLAYLKKLKQSDE